MSRFSFSRILAVMAKEGIQMRRDRITFATMIGIPIFQLIIFGYAINVNPHDLRTAVQIRESGTFSRSIVSALETSDYFQIVAVAEAQEDIDRLLRTGEVAFVVIIPEGFERDVIHGGTATITIEADATDPSASGSAINALNEIVRRAIARDVPSITQKSLPFEVVVHRHYNPAGVTHVNIVPGLLGVILTMTMVIITAIAITREAERGTLENLLAMPVRPLEVMIGKVVPYIAVGAVQAGVIILAARFLFGIPITGPLPVLVAGIALFILTNLSIGYLFSTIAKSQMQAMQLSFFFLLPSILLSGFMFPFSGMPLWARAIGECLPATHFMRIARAVMLKGADMPDMAPEFFRLGLIWLVVATLALWRFRRTLD